MPLTCSSKKSTSSKTDKADSKPAAVAVTTAQQYIDAISRRRSIYHIGNKLKKDKKEVTRTIQDAVRQCPSSFNVQSSRVAILYGAEHEKVWEIVKAALKKVTNEEQYTASEAKVNGCFLSGAGTVLFYEDQYSVKGQQEAFPSYASNFPVWSEHSSAIAQYAVWTALAQDGIGATLQHYNELIEADLREAFAIPEHWKLIAQMPFGSIEKPADAKTYIDDETRFIVRGE
ncbi:hypothetical protein ABL78_0320 [Leptomonas seymouri]|uniref:Nitroreductase domain-containing protein n=1 Tax=Leptomonas seymouri TaxID=5684 RepID=A0A0N1IAF5_LEPSE|nr:hypothetical protein ABL78_0320 [Leptomonas seymouri]|eukprot:KPI90560.1 hypothetical protein ABL78_0320 [Leptomonas seymouri]